MAERDRGKVELSAALGGLPTEQVTLRIASPVDVRLDQLVDLLLTRVRSVTRGDLVSALIHGAPEDLDELHMLLRTFEDDPVHKTLPGMSRTSGRYALPPKKPGPRPRRS